MTLKNLESAFLHQLGDILYAEKRLTNVLPQLIEKAHRDDLKQALQEHYEQTRQHVQRVEQAFKSIDRNPTSEQCEAIEGIVEEGEHMLEGDGNDQVRDAVVIAAAQKSEHYEIATYGTLCKWAEQLEYEEAKRLLGENLSEEKEADQKLTQMAEQKVNPEALRAAS